MVLSCNGPEIVLRCGTCGTEIKHVGYEHGQPWPFADEARALIDGAPVPVRRFVVDASTRNYAAASGISWILSYAIVYVFQKCGGFGAMGRETMLREIAYYAVAVVGLSATVNFGVVTVLKDFDPTLVKAAAVAVAAIAAALVAWFVSTRILRIGGC